MKKTFLAIPLFLFLTFVNLRAQLTSVLPPIEKIIVSDGILLQIERSPEYTLQIKTQELDSTCLINTVKDGTLTLKIISGFGCRGKVIANLGCPGLKVIEATAQAEVTSKNLMLGDSLKIVLKSGGQAYIDLDIQYLKAELSEWGMLKSEGYAVQQDISVATLATFSGYILEGQKVNIKSSTGGKAKICVTDELNAKATTNGYISYKCQPKQKSIEMLSGGTIEEYSE